MLLGRQISNAPPAREPKVPYRLDTIYIWHILTDMKRMLIVFDDKTADLLSQYPNKSKVVREATELYIAHILPDTMKGIRASYKVFIAFLEKLSKEQQEMDSKLDYIAKRVQ